MAGRLDLPELPANVRHDDELSPSPVPLDLPLRQTWWPRPVPMRLCGS